MKLDGENVSARMFRAFVSTKLGFVMKAVLDYSKAIFLAPQLITAYECRAALYQELQHHVLAVKDFSIITLLSGDVVYIARFGQTTNR